MKTQSFFRLLLLSGVLCCGLAIQARAQNLLQNGDFANGMAPWVIPSNAKSQPSVVTLTGGPSTQALRVTLAPAEGDKPWNIVLRQPLNAALKKGDGLILKAWLRSPQSLKAFAFLEAKDEKYTKSLEKILELSPEWKEFEIRGISKGDYAAGLVSAGFHLGYGAGVVEIASVRLMTGAVESTPVAPPVAAPAPSTAAPVARDNPSPEKPQALLQNGDFGNAMTGWVAQGIIAPKVEIVSAPVNGKDQKIARLSIPATDGLKPWNVRFTQKSNVAVAKGDFLVMRLWARSPQKNSVGLIYQQSVEPFDKSLNKLTVLSSEWKEYQVRGVAKSDFAAQESNFELHLGYAAGIIEIADVRVDNFGAASSAQVDQKIGVLPIDYFGGQAHSDTWRAAALQRIEKIRKADLQIAVVDKNGKPVPNAEIKVAQKRHLFRWGSAVPARRLLDKTDADNLRFQAEVLRLFNTVTFENDLKWDNKNPEKLGQALAASKWLNANGIHDIRGHTLLWGAQRNMPPGIMQLEKDALLTAIRGHVTEYAGWMKNRVYVWDVVNETITNEELWNKVGWDNFAEAYRWAKAADPNAKLAYNDYDITNDNKGAYQRNLVKKRIQLLIDKKVPFDIIGDQAHMSVPLTPIYRVLEILDEMAKFGKPIEITEFDVQVLDDKIHGDYVRDFLIAAFSHPRVEAFVMWGFWEKSHWLAKEGGAMFRADWSKRPAQEAYEDLVLKQWTTNATGTTGANGVLQTRGFLGDYEITASTNGKTQLVKATLAAGGKNLEIKMK